MMTAEQLELHQITGTEWVILDRRYPAHDPRATVASILRAADGECEVTWLVDVALPTRYVCPANVVEDLRRSVTRRTKPIPIPHFAPVGMRPSRRSG